MVKYVKDFEFSSAGPKLVRGYMRGGACGYAKGGAAKSAPKSLSIMVAVGAKKPAPPAKKGTPPVMAVPIGLKKGGDAKGKVGVVMKEFGKGELHSGSDKGPLVKNPKQAIAIGISEARNAGAKIPVKKQMGGLMKGVGALTDAERAAAAKASLAKAPTRAQYDAMMVKRAAADAVRSKLASAMTPAERNQISGGEGVDPMSGKLFGRPYKKGGSAKC
jgi:hypothetical protein